MPIGFIIRKTKPNFELKEIAKESIPFLLFIIIFILDYILVDEIVYSMIIIIASLVIMIIFAGKLLEAGEKLAIKLKVSPFLIGLVIIPFLSSIHEQILSILSNIKNTGFGEMSLAQQLGNKTFELLIGFGVLGYLICRFGNCIKLDKKSEQILTIRNGVFMIMGTILLACLSLIDGNLNRQDGIILIFFYCLFIFVVYLTNRFEFKEIENEDFENPKNIILWQELIKIMIYLSIIIFMSNFVSDRVLYLNSSYEFFNKFSFIIMGILLALPNFIISVIGLKKGKQSIILGLIIGSAIWELSISIAIILLINPIESFTGFSATILIITMILSGFISIVYIRTKWSLKSWEALFLILLYVSIVTIVILFT